MIANPHNLRSLWTMKTGQNQNKVAPHKPVKLHIYFYNVFEAFYLESGSILSDSSQLLFMELFPETAVWSTFMVTPDSRNHRTCRICGNLQTNGVSDWSGSHQHLWTCCSKVPSVGHWQAQRLIVASPRSPISQCIWGDCGSRLPGWWKEELSALWQSSTFLLYLGF